MRYPKLRELREAIRAVVKGPYTNRFPFLPHKPYEKFRGKPEFHENDCVGCGACFQVCPAKAIEMHDVKDKRVLTVHWDLCIFCGQCQANCITEKGIILSNEFDLATTEKREDLKQEIKKQLLMCEGCGEVIAPYEQTVWVAKKLGPLCFSNASLMLVMLRDFPATAGSCPGLHEGREKLASQETVLSKKDNEFSRADRIKILCPACRREAVLKS